MLRKTSLSFFASTQSALCELEFARAESAWVNYARFKYYHELRDSAVLKQTTSAPHFFTLKEVQAMDRKIAMREMRQWSTHDQVVKR